MSDEADLLSILNVHGQNFLGSFSQPSQTSNKKRKRATKDDLAVTTKVRIVYEEEDVGEEDEDEDEDEWQGFGSKGGESSAETDEDSEGEGEDEDTGSEDEIEGVLWSL